MALSNILQGFGSWQKGNQQTWILSSNNIEQEGILALTSAFNQFPGLSYLDVTSNNITDKGALYLAGVSWTGVRGGVELFVKNNSISPAVCTLLTKAVLEKAPNSTVQC